MSALRGRAKAKKSPERNQSVPLPSIHQVVPVLSGAGGSKNAGQKKGHTGNPSGLPGPNARAKLSKYFLESVLDFWARNGERALQLTMEQNPAVLVATIARLIPKDFQVTVSGDVHIHHELSPQQRQKIAESWIISQQNQKQVIDVAHEVTEAVGQRLIPAKVRSESKTGSD